MQLCLVSAVASLDHDGRNDDLCLLPNNPEVEDGGWLTLNCTILPHYSGNYTNRHLYFRYGNVNYTNFTRVGNKTALLTLQWTLAEGGVSGGHIRCALPDRPWLFKAVQAVTVIRRPMQPTVTGCLLWNWKQVNCTWQPSSSQQQDHMHTSLLLNQTVQWMLTDEVSEWQDADCAGEAVDSSCMWNVSHIVNRFIRSESCCVRVFAGIHLHRLRFEVQSAQFCFHPEHNVVLDRPRNVTAVNAGAHEISVEWLAPLSDLKDVSSADMVYAVVVMSQWSDLAVVNTSIISRSLAFSSVPHTTYMISVTVRTVDSEFWSKPASYDITTAPAIPKMSPPSSTNAFAVSHVEKYIRTVIIYWKKLSVEDYYGERLSYIVLVRRAAAVDWTELSVVPSANKSCTDVVVNTDADTELTVVSRNEVGDTLPDVVIHLPAVQSSEMTTSVFTEFIVELTNVSTVLWSWQLESLDSAGSLTLFWYGSRFPAGHCVDDIQWHDVPASESEYKLSIDADDTSHYYYGAALKPESIHTANSGIEWVTCLYNVNGLAEPARDVRASSSDAGELMVTWVHPPCDDTYQHGYIRSFMLYYCRHADTGCIGEPSHVSVPGYLTAYNLTGLKPGDEYSVWVYSWTRSGQSPTHSNVVIVVTSASILTPAVIAGLTVSCFIVVILAGVVLCMLCKYCRRCHAKLWSPVSITVPVASPSSTTNAATSAPIVEYSRISYQRQGSRLSSSSRDSGQFGVASGSPLMSPDSAALPLMSPDNHTEQHERHVNSVRPPAMTYVNDEVVVLRRPTATGRHRLSSSTTGHIESFPLQPMKSHEASASKFPTTDVDDGDDEVRVADSLTNTQLNGRCDTAVPHPNTDYIPHEWLKM